MSKVFVVRLTVGYFDLNNNFCSAADDIFVDSSLFNIIDNPINRDFIPLSDSALAKLNTNIDEVHNTNCFDC